MLESRDTPQVAPRLANHAVEDQRFGGFEHFNRAFRKCAGMAPGRFRSARSNAPASGVPENRPP
jgi:hypothetical protein